MVSIINTPDFFLCGLTDVGLMLECRVIHYRAESPFEQIVSVLSGYSQAITLIVLTRLSKRSYKLKICELPSIADHAKNRNIIVINAMLSNGARIFEE